MAIITITSKDGKTTMNVDGVVGQTCEELTGPLEAALGGDTSREHKPEYWETERDMELQ